MAIPKPVDESTGLWLVHLEADSQDHDRDERLGKKKKRSHCAREASMWDNEREDVHGGLGQRGFASASATRRSEEEKGCFGTVKPSVKSCIDHVMNLGPDT